MTRHGSIIGLKADQLDEYKRLHAAVWPDILAKISECHIRNYSIFLRKLPDGQLYLFSYFEYIGSDFAEDMQKMADDPRTQEWWAVCKPCQQSLPDLPQGGWWADMDEVFHAD